MLWAADGSRDLPRMNAGGRRWMAMTALTLAGLVDAVYLTWYHYDPAVRACIAAGSCETVNASRFAMLAGVPVALIGAAGYLCILTALAARRWGPSETRVAAGYLAYG